jgi:hypothetical protein
MNTDAAGGWQPAANEKAKPADRQPTADSAFVWQSYQLLFFEQDFLAEPIPTT